MSLFYALLFFFFFFFNDTATTEIYTLSLHDALPICPYEAAQAQPLDQLLLIVGEPSTHLQQVCVRLGAQPRHRMDDQGRSEEHTSELQSLAYLVCRLLLEKKKKQNMSEFQKYKQHTI